MGEGTPGRGKPFAREEPHPLGLRSAGLAPAPAWLMTQTPTAMAPAAMNLMGPSPAAHLRGAHTALPPAMARTQPCWRPPRAARGAYGCVVRGPGVVLGAGLGAGQAHAAGRFLILGPLLLP